jgi:hypothetical protein
VPKCADHVAAQKRIPASVLRPRPSRRRRKNCACRNRLNAPSGMGM